MVSTFKVQFNIVPLFFSVNTHVLVIIMVDMIASVVLDFSR